MPRKNLYYSERDEALVEAAERVAERKGISLSRFVLDALEVHVPQAAAEPARTPPERWAEIAAEPQPQAARA